MQRLTPDSFCVFSFVASLKLCQTLTQTSTLTQTQNVKLTDIFLGKLSDQML